MTTQISQEMIAASAIPALMAELGIGEVEIGDLTWSARSAKTGWLKCEGQAVSRTTYAALFTEIGTTFGVGDEATTFNLPDGRGRALIGVGTGSGLTARALGDSDGFETHTLTAAEIPAHAHTQTAIPSGTAGASGAPVMANTSVGSSAAGSTSNSTGGDGAHNNMQPFLAANLFIFAGV